MTDINDVYNDLLLGNFEDYREAVTKEVILVLKLSTKEVFAIVNLSVIPSTKEVLEQLNNMKCVINSNKPGFLMSEEVFYKLSPSFTILKEIIRKSVEELKE